MNLSLAIIAILIISTVAWKDRSWAAAAVLFLLPTYLLRFSIAGVPLTVLEVMILALFIIFVIRDWRKIIKLQPNWWQVLLLALFILAAIFGLLVTPDFRAGLGIFKAYIVEPVLFFLVIWIGLDNKQQVRRLLLALVVAAAVSGLATGMQYLTGWGIPEPWNLWNDNRRATLWYGYPNAIGLFIAPILVATFSLIMTTGKRYRSWLLLASACMIIGLLSAQVEGAYVAAMAGVFVVMLSVPRLRYWVIVAAAALLTAVLSFDRTRQLLLFQDT